MKNIFKKVFSFFLYKRENEINKKLNIINIELSKLRKEVENLKSVKPKLSRILEIIDKIEKPKSNRKEIFTYDVKGYEPKLTSEERINLIKRNNPELLKDLNTN